jgi:MSHA biogenesis protein MshQ
VGSDYLGTGNVTGTTSSNVGRFYPARFDTTLTQGCTAGNFTYSGQPMSSTIVAKNLGGNTLINYDRTSFAKGVNLTDANTIPGALSVTTVAASSFVSGVAPVSPAFTFTTRATGPSIIRLRASDPTDSVNSSTGSEGTSTIVSGRLSLPNAYGSELLALPMSLTAQYWDGSGYVLNALDSCTSLTVPTSVSGMVFGAGNLTAGETTASLRGVSSGSVVLLNGNGVLSLTKPGTGNSGFVDITVTAPTWLQYPWTSSTPSSPKGRATFGIYKSPLIYRRENY